MPALKVMGSCYLSGTGVEQDANKALDLFQQAANLGDADAMCQLACMYLTDDYFPHDYEKTLSLLKQAAALGSSEAEELLGEMPDEDTELQTVSERS